MTARERLLDVFAAAVATADPGAATTAALSSVTLPSNGRVHLIAIGKASQGMAHAAHEWLAAHDLRPAGGVIVTPSGDVPPPDAHLTRVVGDHPVPGAGSLRAAVAVGHAAAAVSPDDLALVLLSGGASALVAAPVADGIPVEALAECTRVLLASGADIGVMNAVRKRFSRWGAGRLALALAPARVCCLAISDVAGDDPAVIGSGPCAPDPLSARSLVTLLHERGLLDALPHELTAYLNAVTAAADADMPKPDDAAFARVQTRIILTNADARRGAFERARALGLRVSEQLPEIAGEAHIAGERIADVLSARATGCLAPELLVWGGESTVTLPAGSGVGGRCQELALSAALRLATGGGEISLLAAGTDGRDGPTDAAGAVIDGTTCARIHAAGVDPLAALRRHDAYAALAAAGSLVFTGPTGTNVRDVVLGLITPAGHRTR